MIHITLFEDPDEKLELGASSQHLSAHRLASEQLLEMQRKKIDGTEALKISYTVQLIVPWRLVANYDQKQNIVVRVEKINNLPLNSVAQLAQDKFAF